MKEIYQYEGKIKPVFKCDEDYKKMFNHASCLLTISVGQEVHEKEKFLTTIELVNKEFKECTILVDDSLQRHTMALELGKTPDELYEESVKEGDLWLIRNKHLYTKLSIPYSIIRWDKWLKHENFNYWRQKISESYINDISYQEKFNMTIEEFLMRYRRRIENSFKFNEELAFNYCLEYLKEECSALCLWVEGKFNFEVYPGKRNQAMTATHEKFIKPYDSNLLNPIAIKFKNRKQLKPQIFNYQTEESLY